jgi:hypothetical protein
MHDISQVVHVVQHRGYRLEITTSLHSVIIKFDVCGSHPSFAHYRMSTMIEWAYNPQGLPADSDADE